jgi:hypothetical protein
MKTLFESPCPSSLRMPVMLSEDVDLYRPGARVSPPRSPDTEAGKVRPAALLYAAVKSTWAKPAGPSAACIAPPMTCPGGNPVTAVPGLTPRSPFSVVGPVLVAVEAAKTVKLPAEPRGTGNWADCIQKLNDRKMRRVLSFFNGSPL